MGRVYVILFFFSTLSSNIMPQKVTHYIFLIRNILIVDAVYKHSVIPVNQHSLLEMEFFVKQLTALKRIYFYLFIDPQYL